MSKDKIKKGFDFMVKHVSLLLLAFFAYVGFKTLVIAQTNEVVVYFAAIVLIGTLAYNTLDR